MKAVLRLSSVLAVLVLLVAACDDTGGDTAATITTTTPAMTATTSTTSTTSTTTTTTTTTTVPTTTTTTPTTTTQPEPALPEVFDGRIGVAVVEIATDRVAPPEIDFPAAEAGHTYLIIHFTVPRIESVHLVSLFGYEDERPFVQDAAGHTYKIAAATVRGLKSTDPTEFMSPTEVIEGAEGVLLFKVPEGSLITDLTLIYSHRASWDETSPEERGEMTLVLDAGA